MRLLTNWYVTGYVIDKTYNDDIMTGDVHIITIHSSPTQQGLGFSIRGGSEHGLCVYVSDIDRGSVAGKCLCIYVSDIDRGTVAGKCLCIYVGDIDRGSVAGKCLCVYVGDIDRGSVTGECLCIYVSDIDRG